MADRWFRFGFARLAFALVVPSVLAVCTACGDDEGGGGGDTDDTTTDGDTDTPAACTASLQPGETDQTTVQTALVNARAGDVVCFGQGSYRFTAELTVAQAGVTLRGQPGGRPVLDFGQLDSGAQGVLVNQADDFTMENLTILDPPGDGVRVNGADGVTFRAVSVIWSAGPSTANGAYGIYPVTCTNVLIEDSIVSGASDAGIYVGQSSDIIVRRNTASQNVAGIEIENSQDAAVYDNIVTDNTAGILVFNLPGLPVGDGRRTNVYNNVIVSNNRTNFGSPGTIVSQVPAGAGMFVMANDQVEVHHNFIGSNVSTGIVILDYGTFDSSWDDAAFDPAPETIFIHDNVFATNGTSPVGLFKDIADSPFVSGGGVGLGGDLSDILWDGRFDSTKPDPMGRRFCIQNNRGNFLNADAWRAPGDPIPPTLGASTFQGDVTCTHPALPPVVLTP